MSKLIQFLLGAVLLITGQLGVVEAADCAAIALAAIPHCAQSCFLNGAPSIGCGSIDFACQCASEARLYAAIEGCVAAGCPSASYQVVIDGASSVCDCATAGPAVGSGSASISGISGIGGTVAPGSFTTTTPVSTTAAATTTGGSSAASSTQPTTTTAPGSTTPANTPFTTTITPFATASAVNAGSARSGLVDVRLVGTMLAALAVGFALF